MPKVFKFLRTALAPNTGNAVPRAATDRSDGSRKASFTSSTDDTWGPDFDPLTVSAFELSELLNAQAITSVQIVRLYLKEIEMHNRRGRQLRALISVAPKHELVRIARKLDEERARGKIRGPLHGIPIVLKDNIMTDEKLGMDTTVVGVVPMDGIFSLSKTFDAVGGMAKSAKDLVALIDAMMVPTSREENARSPHRSFKIKPDFGTLRIGICEPTIWKAWRKSGRINGDAERFMKYDMIVQSMIEMGVDIVYPVELPNQSSLTIDGKNCFEPVVYSEFKDCLAEFIRDFRVTKMHSLAEIINFNLDHPELCLPPTCPDQNDLMAALQATTKREEVNAARQHLQTAAGPEGLDFLFSSQKLDIIIAPGDAALSTLAAAAGYPTAACPLSALKLNGQPFGLTLASRPHTEHMLLHFLTAYENIFPPRALPLALSSVPLQDPNPEPLPDQPIIDLILHEWDTSVSCSADALADWLNARWRKSGFCVLVGSGVHCDVIKNLIVYSPRAYE
ncbi:amidase family protein [Pyrenophora tritici-repentis Pt-1C-BFP]|uniref:Amidase family protein n=1 Tax=Pyrenophora tritici-repentis (strain Pt-1C-BFP) TaxID=426418 RepID=B2WI64_PYRTR|nr:amidase family protein [Pyrenophora tritici-repentis Pt-1C-BFP]EDU42724.1 amidase family protein [Pyrenophora tritici-repentis Pt-1C-BFP]